MNYPTPHINATPDDFAKTVLMPGDPLRSKYIAENFLENPVLVNNVRGVQGYTGTYKGVRVSVMASGMGMPSIGIYSHELYNVFGVENIMRIGSAGAIQPQINLKDIVMAMGASTDSAWADQFHLAGTFAPICSYKMLRAAIASAEELALFAKQVTDEGMNYSGYTVNITSDIDLGENLWKPIKSNGKMSGITIDGGNHTIHNMMVRSCTNPNKGGYGAGFIGDTSGAITIKDITFDNADVSFHSYYVYSGNIGSIVMGYTYGTTVFENVSVTNSEIWGYGKIGCLLGMGADPGVSVTFKNCTSRNNTIYAAYDIGGLAGNIQRKNGVDNGKVENCVVEGITVNYAPDSTYVDIQNATATLRSNDQPSGTEITKTVTGKYLDESGYYWCGYGDYYVSYGHSSYDAPVEGYDKCLANSEYPVNK